MKILRFTGFFFIFSSLFFSCSTTKVESADPENPVSEIASEQESPVDYPVKKEAEVWTDNSGKSLPVSDGIVTLRYKKRVGSFNIAVRNQAEKNIPVFSTANEYTSSSFFLKSNNKIIKLINDGAVKSGYTKSDRGLRITYAVADTADVVIEFVIFPSREGEQSDMVKVTATVTNKSQRRKELALKAVLDTILGETDAWHFYTRLNVPVKNEVLYKTMENEKWIVSRNASAAMQIFFYGSDCTAPEAVALGNYSTFDKNEWLPNMYSYRQFDSVFAYNNSAVEAVWPAFKLNPNESGKCVFYMAFAAGYDTPKGEKYLFPDADETEGETPLVLPETPSQDKVTTRTIETYVPEEDDENQKLRLPKKTEKKTKKKINPNNFSNQQLTPEYVQNLLDRIIALEEDDATLNRAEIYQLNAELDAILDVLGL